MTTSCGRVTLIEAGDYSLWASDIVGWRGLEILGE